MTSMLCFEENTERARLRRKITGAAPEDVQGLAAQGLQQKRCSAGVR